MRLIILLFGLLFAPLAGAKDILILRQPTYAVILSDQECSPEVKRHIRTDWRHPVAAGRVVILDPKMTSAGGKKELKLCYSIIPGGVTLIDEDGDGPDEPVPIILFEPINVVRTP